MRYALYYSPAPESSLAQLGARWLGRNVFSGERIAQHEPSVVGAAAFADMTSEPRRYGFHATLKAPFSLAGTNDEQALCAAIEAFAASAASCVVGRLVVRQVYGFLALTLTEDSESVRDFAAEVVRRFDPFRAPPSPEELERRRRSQLSARGEELLGRWGYPYVMDDFRFHMTLTSRLSKHQLDAVESEARTFFSPALQTPASIEAISLFIEPAAGEPFIVKKSWPLTGQAWAS